MELRHLKKSVVFLFFTFILVSTLTNFYSPMPDLAQAVTIPTMYVDPPTIGSGLIVGDSFTVDVMISDTDINEDTDVYAWQVLVTWDNTVLDIDDVVAFGDFMDVPRIGSWGLLTADAAAGQDIVNVADGSKYANPGAWGGAVLIQDDLHSETNTVVDQSGNQLTLQDNLANTYAVAGGGGAYPWPGLFPSASVGLARNRIMVGQTTLGAPPGVSGSGWLCTLTFNVLADGETTLDIDSEYMGDQTYITNTLKEDLGDDPSGPSDPGYWQSELLKESGNFNNGITPTTHDLTVGVVGSGSTDPAVGVHTYDEGTLVPVDAIPIGGWVLDYWLFDGVDVGSADPYVVTMDDDHSLTAYFVEVPPVQYTLTISVIGSGTTVPSAGSYLYDAGDVDEVASIADFGWVLDYWLLDGVDVGSVDPYTVIMNDDHALTAVFTEETVQYTLTVSVVGSGTTDPAPGGHLYDAGLGVPVDAIPIGGWMLDYWLFDGVDVGSTDPYIVTMDDDHSLTAFFAEVSAPLMYVDPSVVSAGPGESFTLNISIQNVDDLFSYEVKLGFNKTVLGPTNVEEGPFIRDQTTSPLGTLWSTIYGADYVYAVCVTMGLYPGVSGSGNLFTVTFNVLDTGESDLPLYDSILLDSNGALMSHSTADGYFYTPAPTQYELTVGVVGSGSTDPAVGVHTYDEGTLVPVDAIPIGGWVLDYWLFDGVDVGSADPYVVTMDDDHSLTAYFVEVPPVEYTLTVSVVGSGTTDPVPGGHLYDAGLGVPVDAIPDGGWVLDYWLFDGVDVGSADPYVVTMDADHALTAVFTEIGVDVTPPTITINEPVAGDYLHCVGMILDFNAVDTESGVASISATLDGTIVENGDLIELFTLSLGQHTLIVTAVDNAGNSATETVEFNVIATIDSLICLVEKFYDLGYIDEGDVKAGLLAKLLVAQKKIETGAPKKIEVAKKILNAFINQVKAQSGKHLRTRAADILLADVQHVLDNL